MSDSASLDNFFEFLIVNGMDFFKSARSLIPAPWQNAPHMDAKLRAFYEYVSTCFEAWDGPAAVSMTNGRYIGCVLDRNGLRPSKYIITKDNRLIISSEYGVLDIEEDDIVERGRLQSGQMMGVDLKYGTVLKNCDIDNYLKNREPYDKWLNENMTYLQEHMIDPFSHIDIPQKEEMEARQRFFNITLEVQDQILASMAEEGKETTASMGDDTPLAAFSNKQRNFSDFFREKFAQVTNPPIDPIREKVVMSLNTGFGEARNILTDDALHAKRLKTVSPILSLEKLEILKAFGNEKDARYDANYKSKTYSTSFTSNLKESLQKLTSQISDDVKNEGIRIIVLDDRDLDKDNNIMPMLMVVGALNETLLKTGVRHLTSVVAVSGEVYDSHMAACMIAFGAAAIYPYMMYQSIAVMEKRKDENVDLAPVLKKVRKAINAGLLKIMSKMGISTIASYRNSSLFDVIGLSKDIVEDCFNGAYSLLHGLSYEDIEYRVQKAHKEAFCDNVKYRLFPLNIGGFYKYLDGGEYHDYAPSTVHAIHALSKSGKKRRF